MAAVSVQSVQNARLLCRWRMCMWRRFCETIGALGMFSQAKVGILAYPLSIHRSVICWGFCHRQQFGQKRGVLMADVLYSEKVTVYMSFEQRRQIERGTCCSNEGVGLVPARV